LGPVRSPAIYPGAGPDKWDATPMNAALSWRASRSGRVLLAVGRDRQQLDVVSSTHRDPAHASAGTGIRNDSPDRTDRFRDAEDSGDLMALDELLPTLFDELRAVAHRHLTREQDQVTLQTTGLVHEAYLRLLRGNGVGQKGRAYFFAAAARAMRQVLVDAARRRRATKRGTGERPVSLDEVTESVTSFSEDLLALDRALLRLEEEHPRPARVVECRFFSGLSVDDTAEALGVSARTVKADWALARAWLYDMLMESAAA
jgi:RNA polymerase sigma factor (TIGR02999 family)